MIREINILKRAVEEGFVFNSYDSLDEILDEAYEFFDDYPADIVDTPDDFGGNYLSWSDGKGFERNVTGEFYTYEDLRRARARGEEKILVDRFLDTDANVVELYVDIE